MGQEQIRIFDTTLRDGEQAPGFSLRPAEKLLLARQLDVLGVDIIEAGFPIASPADAEAVRRIATEIRRPVIACLARCHRADLEKAAWSIKPAAQGRIHTFIATSDLHLQAKLRITREQCIEAAVDAVRFARHHTFDVQFSAEDATRSDMDFLCRVIEAVIKVGASTINLPDTVGYSTPDETLDFFKTIASGCRIPTMSSSARTATTTWVLASPTRSPRSPAERVRSNARSTASASGPGTRRSRRSSWPCASAPIVCRT
jgi:2-isopropylmalate synthase